MSIKFIKQVSIFFYFSCLISVTFATEINLVSDDIKAMNEEIRRTNETLIRLDQRAATFNDLVEVQGNQLDTRLEQTNAELSQVNGNWETSNAELQEARGDINDRWEESNEKLGDFNREIGETQIQIAQMENRLDNRISDTTDRMDDNWDDTNRNWQETNGVLKGLSSPARVAMLGAGLASGIVVGGMVAYHGMKLIGRAMGSLVGLIKEKKTREKEKSEILNAFWRSWKEYDQTREIGIQIDSTFSYLAELIELGESSENNIDFALTQGWLEEEVVGIEYELGATQKELDVALKNSDKKMYVKLGRKRKRFEQEKGKLQKIEKYLLEARDKDPCSVLEDLLDTLSSYRSKLTKMQLDILIAYFDYFEKMGEEHAQTSKRQMELLGKMQKLVAKRGSYRLSKDKKLDVGKEFYQDTNIFMTSQRKVCEIELKEMSKSSLQAYFVKYLSKERYDQLEKKKGAKSSDEYRKKGCKYVVEDYMESEDWHDFSGKFKEEMERAMLRRHSKFLEFDISFQKVAGPLFSQIDDYNSFLEPLNKIFSQVMADYTQMQKEAYPRVLPQERNPFKGRKNMGTTASYRASFRKVCGKRVKVQEFEDDM